MEAKNVPIDKRLLQSPRPSEQLQLTLPLGEAIVRRTIVQLIGVTRHLEPQLLTDEELRRFLYGLHPEEFEELVLDRFLAMGMEAKRVGQYVSCQVCKLTFGNKFGQLGVKVEDDYQTETSALRSR